MPTIYQIAADANSNDALGRPRGRFPRFAAAFATFALTVAMSAQAATPTAAAKASAGPIAIHLTQALVVVVDHKETLRSADQVKPGDLIEYRAVYTNTSAKPVEKLVATLPVPDGLDYVAGSAKPTGSVVRLATKDGKFVPEAVMTANAAASRAVAAIPDYRWVHWTFDKVAVGQSVEVVARARVPAAGVAVASAASAVPGAVALPH
jgi:uncharacterized repeat protein (TIGR01451 family)